MVGASSLNSATGTGDVSDVFSIASATTAGVVTGDEFVL